MRGRENVTIHAVLENEGKEKKGEERWKMDREKGGE